LHATQKYPVMQRTIGVFTAVAFALPRCFVLIVRQLCPQPLEALSAPRQSKFAQIKKIRNKKNIKKVD